MNSLAAVLAAVLVSASASTAWASTTSDYEKDGVRLSISIESQVYELKVTNIDAAPIMRFEYACYNTYNHKSPTGWERSYSYDDGIFRTWTTDPRRAIQPGRSKTFSNRVGSNGAVLGAVQGSVDFGEGTQPIVFDGVWGPVPHPPGILALIPTTIVVIALFHAFVVGRTERRANAGRLTSG